MIRIHVHGIIHIHPVLLFNCITLYMNVICHTFVILGTHSMCSIEAGGLKHLLNLSMEIKTNNFS